MKPDNIYSTLINICPDLDSKIEAWRIWSYILDLLEYERKETVDTFTEALYNNGIDHSNDPRYYKAMKQVL